MTGQLYGIWNKEDKRFVIKQKTGRVVAHQDRGKAEEYLDTALNAIKALTGRDLVGSFEVREIGDEGREEDKEG